MGMVTVTSTANPSNTYSVSSSNQYITATASPTISEPTTLTGTVIYSGTSKTIYLIPDTTPPTFSFTSTNSSWAKTDGTFQVTSFTDTGSGPEALKYRVDGGAWLGLSQGQTATVSSEGDHLVEIQGSDHVGNSKTESFHVKVDKSLPVLGSLTGIPSVPVNTQQSLKGVFTDSLSGLKTIQYTIRTRQGPSGNWLSAGSELISTTSGSAVTVPPSDIYSDGYYMVHYVVTDNADNQLVYDTAAFPFDKSAPTIMFSPVSTQLQWYNNGALTLSATDAGPSGLASLQYSTGSAAGPWTLWTPGGSLTFPDGSRTVYVRALDNAGNESTANQVFNVDTTAPVIEWKNDNQILSAPTYYYNAGQTLTLDVTEANVDASRSTYTLNSGNTVGLTQGRNSITLSAPSPAGLNSYTISASVTDLAGNSSGVTGKTFHIDNLGVPSSAFALTLLRTGADPLLVGASAGYGGNFSGLVFSLPPDENWGAKPVAAKVDISSGDAQVYSGEYKTLTLTNGTYIPVSDLFVTASASVHLSDLADGASYTLTVTVLDEAGNESAYSKTLSVDRSAPLPDKNWLAPGTGTTFQIAVPQGLAEGGLKVYQTASDFVVNSESTLLWNTTAQNSGSLGLDAAGQGTISLVAEDQYGNRSNKAIHVLRPPVQPVGMVKRVNEAYNDYSLVIPSPQAPPVFTVGTRTVGYAIAYEGYGSLGINTAQGSANGEWSTVRLAASGALAGVAFTYRGVLTPTSVPADNDILALPAAGGDQSFSIPNSPPRFLNVNPLTAPEYLNSASSVTWSPASDPDATQTLQYRLKLTAGSLTAFTAPVSAVTSPLNLSALSDSLGNPLSLEAVKSAVLLYESTLTLEAWDGFSQTPWSEGTASAAKTYPLAGGSRFDFQAPSVSVGSPWASAVVSNADSFTVTVRDAGTSGLASAILTLTPVTALGTDDTASGRPTHILTSTGASANLALTAGASEASFTVVPAPGLMGRYRLEAAVLDRAGNASSFAALIHDFDTSPPVVNTLVYSAPQDSQSRILPDGLGHVKVTLGTSENGSGIAQWAYRLQNGSHDSGWVWSTWVTSELTLGLPTDESVKEFVVAYKVKDAAGNESAEKSGGTLYFDPAPPQFALEVSGLSSYVGDKAALSASVSLSGEAAGAVTAWRLVWEEAGVDRETDDFADFNALKNSSAAPVGTENLPIWQDGVAYRIKAVVTNPNGIASGKESETFTLDQSAPTAVSLSPAAAEAGRSFYYQNEPFAVNWTGGEDPHSAVTRSLALYAQSGGQQTLLKSVNVTGGQAVLDWQSAVPFDWSSAFFVRGQSVNASGRTSVSPAVPVSVGGAGLGIFIPSYNDGSGVLPVSWTRWEGAAAYSLRLWKSSTPDLALGPEPLTTGQDFSQVDLSSLALAAGERIYAEVRALDAQGAVLFRGRSLVSLVDRTAPLLGEVSEAQAVTASAVRVSLDATDVESGVTQARWLVEKREGSDRWTVLTDASGSTWRTFPGTGDQDLVVNLGSEGVVHGDRLKITVLAENGAGLAAQRSSAILVVDDTPPPAPVVWDQGDALNADRQAAYFHWKLSRVDPESGLKDYYYGYFIAGESTEPALWTRFSGADNAVPELALNHIASGKTVYFAVKAVNQAGLASIGYSNGLILDSRAPLIHLIKIANAAGTKELTGYIEPSDLGASNEVAVSIIGGDPESWVNGAAVQRHHLDAFGAPGPAVGKPVAFTALTGSLALGSGSQTSQSWILTARAYDAAGNVSALATSEGLLVQGAVPDVAGLGFALDSQELSLSWSADGTEAAAQWIRGYRVSSVSSTGKTSLSTVSSPSYSSLWGASGLGLSAGESVTFTVQVLPYSGAATAGRSVTVVIDDSAPVLVSSVHPVPSEASHWHDRLRGRLQYEDAQTGIGEIQWKAYLVPGSTALTDWEGRRSVGAYDYEKLLSALPQGNTPTYWHGKQILIRHRAVNSMGFWTNESVSSVIAVDATEPRITVNRGNAYTNALSAVGDWSLQTSDEDSGVLAWQGTLVPASATAADYDWSLASTQSAAVPPGGELAQTVSLDLPALSGEGLYKPLIRVKNGTGDWFLLEGTVLLTVDRTPPRIIEFAFAGAQADTPAGGTGEPVWVTNLRNQAYSTASDEPVVMELTSPAPLGLSHSYPASGFTISAAGTVAFGTLTGGVYELTLSLTDRAGNRSFQSQKLRLNQAPIVLPIPSALITTPGKPLFLEDLMQVSDPDGDYALSFEWLPGGGNADSTWQGGSVSEPWGTGVRHEVKYYHQTEKAQQSQHAGSVKVTDRFGQSSTVGFTVTVENTTTGPLYVDEYWSGAHNVTGWVDVPTGLTLTLDNAQIGFSGALGDAEFGIVDAGLRVAAGAYLVVTNPASSSSLLSSASAGLLWRGLEVHGQLSGHHLEIRQSERGLSLFAGGTVNLNEATFARNLAGVHLLGGTLRLERALFEFNEEYGIKEDAPGDYGLMNSVFQDNGRNYYQEEQSVLSLDEINGLGMSYSGNTGAEE